MNESCNHDVLVDIKSNCPCSGNKGKALDGSYIDGPLVASVIDLGPSYRSYLDTVRRKRSGKAIKHRNLAKNKGYVCRQFHWNSSLAKIKEINRSKSVRCGGPMRESYLQKPTVFNQAIGCLYHWCVPWGVFDRNGELVGYIKLARFGELALYSQILGHGDHLKNNIMHHLHLSVIEKMYDRGPCEGVRYLMYGAHNSGNGSGLRTWKERFGFEPRRLKSVVD